MKRKGEVFRRAFLICIILVVISVVLLVAAYTYFGRKTYISLEREQLNKTADSAQELFCNPADQTLSRTTFSGYLDAISYSNDTSYILLFSKADDPDYYYNTNISDYESSPYIREIYDLVLSGEELDFEKFQLTESKNAICVGRPLYPKTSDHAVGCFYAFITFVVDRFAYPDPAVDFFRILCRQSDAASAVGDDKCCEAAFQRQLRSACKRGLPG